MKRLQKRTAAGGPLFSVFYSPMGAPQWGQNLLSLAAPQTGQTLKVTSDSVSYTHLTVPTNSLV
mgnify:CR=1 FL=1